LFKVAKIDSTFQEVKKESTRMSDKRMEGRCERRIQLRFGVGSVTAMGFTDDISEGGMFIRCATFQPIGTTVLIQLDMDDTEKIVLEGTVQWSIRISPVMLRQGKKGGMGVKISRILEGEDAYRKLLGS
jgi:Tfp pilus assembly protein PilZ